MRSALGQLQSTELDAPRQTAEKAPQEPVPISRDLHVDVARSHLKPEQVEVKRGEMQGQDAALVCRADLEPNSLRFDLFRPVRLYRRRGDRTLCVDIAVTDDEALR